MTEFHRFRGNPHFDAPSLRHAVASTLQAEPFFASRDRASIEKAFDDLIGAGVGHPASYEDAFGQVLALNVGLLLRLAGANLDAIASEIARRDVTGLEVVSEALLARMRAQAKDTVPAAPLDPPPDAARIPQVHVPTPDQIELPPLDPPQPLTPEERAALAGNGMTPANPPPTVDEGDEAGVLAVGSTPDVSEFLTSSPAIDLSGRPVAPSGAQDAAPATGDNAPLRYLRDLVDESVQASLSRGRADVGALSARPVDEPGIEPPTAPVADPAPAEARTIEVQAGVAIALSAGVVASLSDAARRAALRQALHAAIDDALGD